MAAGDWPGEPRMVIFYDNPNKLFTIQDLRNIKHFEKILKTKSKSDVKQAFDNCLKLEKEYEKTGDKFDCSLLSIVYKDIW